MLVNRIAPTKFLEQLSTKPQTAVCPACGGLKCLCRPRFYAGQLLTETDLNALDSYIIEKNRLHNRYLHGVGVVSGLKVICHPCPGHITVTEGYALDPCGNDIVVAENTDFDLIERIQECRRKRPDEECDPWRFGETETCDDIEEEWCITIRYQERQANPQTALKKTTHGASCGCGKKGSSGCSCGCNGNGHTSSMTSKTPKPKGAIAACEPSRICEGYVLDVVRAPESSALSKVEAFYERIAASYGTSTALMNNMYINPEALVDTCTLKIFMFVVEQVGSISLPSDGSIEEDAQHAYQVCCRLKEGIRELLQEINHTDCGRRIDLESILCPPFQSTDNPQVYINSLRDTMMSYMELLKGLAEDCNCLSRIPDSPSEAHDNCLLLARVTVKNEQILNISHCECRQQLIHLPSILHALGGSTFEQTIQASLYGDCCKDRKKTERKMSKQMKGENIAVAQSAYNSVQALFNSPYDKPLMTLAKMAVREDQLDVSTLQGQNTETVEALLKAKKMDYEMEPLDDLPSEILSLKSSGDKFHFLKDETLIVHTIGDQVVGFDSLREESGRQRQRDVDLNELRKEVTALQKSLDKLKKGGTRSTKKGSK